MMTKWKKIVLLEFFQTPLYRVLSIYYKPAGNIYAIAIQAFGSEIDEKSFS